VRADRELPFWIPPRVPFVGSFFVPNVGDQIEIEVTSRAPGDQQRGEASLTAHGATYIVTLYNDAQPIPSDFLTHYPQRRGFKTAAGHLLIFDDTDSDPTVTIQDATGHSVTFARDGITLESTGGVSLTVKADGAVEINSATVIYLDGAIAVARHGDTVSPDVGMSTWMAQVAAACNALLPGSVAPPFPPDFGKIVASSTKTYSG
jgi:hypothetical protein